MLRITLNNGDVYTTKLSEKTFLERFIRLDTLRVLTEDYDEGEGNDIFKKTARALNKHKDFTGIIRLNIIEKDFLSYIYYENEWLDDEEKEVLEFYLRY